MPGLARPHPPGAPAEESRWDGLVHWATRFYASRDFVAAELDTTLGVSERLRRARGALLAGSESWATLLERAFGAPNTLTDRPAQGRFLTWCAGHPEAAREALAALWQDGPDAAPAARVQAAIARAGRGLAARPALRLNLVSFLLMALDPTRFPVYDARTFARGYTLARQAPPAPEADEGAVYAHALDFLDRLIGAAARTGNGPGLALGHRLNAAAVLRCVTRGAAPPDWPEAERLALRRYLARPGRPTRARPAPPVAPPAAPIPPNAAPDAPDAPDAPGAATLTLAGLAQALLFAESDLTRIVRLLADRGQCLFYGPPGTGKTYVARRLAAHLAGSESRVVTVQFHAAYAYEDFVEGFRPRRGSGGRSTFDLVEGPLKRLAARAAADPGRRYVLVVDELNRANVARVFGELYYLLEYRDEAVTLQYSGAPFALPPNLWLIGTMNTADRSVALIDLALRRRFYFVPFFPDEPPVAGLLQRYLERYHPDLQWLAGAVDRANRLLQDRHTAVGPSYFLRPDLSPEWIDLIWQHAVLPYVAEQLPDDPAALDDFRLDRLRVPERRRLVAERKARYGGSPAERGGTGTGRAGTGTGAGRRER